MDRCRPPVGGDVIDLNPALSQQFLRGRCRTGSSADSSDIATTMTSAGNRKPVKAEEATGDRRERNANFTGQSCVPPIGQCDSAAASL